MTPVSALRLFGGAVRVSLNPIRSTTPTAPCFPSGTFTRTPGRTRSASRSGISYASVPRNGRGTATSHTCVRDEPFPLSPLAMRGSRGFRVGNET